MKDDKHTRPPIAAIAVTVGCVALAIVHIASPHAKIDGTIVALLGIAALPWLGSIFESIELPGGIKAKYRELDRRVSVVEGAIFRGATPELEARLRDELLAYSAYLSRIGIDTQGPIPQVDVTDAPESMLAAYLPWENRIQVDPRVADDAAHTLHEYTHMALFRAAGIDDVAESVLGVETGLALYLVCAFQNSPRLYRDTPDSRALGLDQFDLEREETLGDLEDPSLSWQGRGLVWAQVLWKLREPDDSRVVDTAVVAAWRVSARTNEKAFASALAERLRERGNDELADRFNALKVERGLSGEPPLGDS